MRKLLLLTLAFVALGAFVYFYEIAGKESRDQAKEREGSILQLDRDAVTEVSIRFPDREVVRIEKVGDGWVLRSPLDTAADTATVDGVLLSLTGAQRDRIFTEEGLDLEAFGLAEPAVRVEVKAGAETKELLVGARDFSGTKVYAKLAEDPSVILTSTSLLTSIDKPVLDWRSKQALTFDRAKVEEVEIQSAGNTIRLQRKDGAWRISAPVEDLADESSVNSLLSTVEFARARDFVAEEPGNLAEYGLDAPVASLRIRESGSDEWRQLDLGKLRGEDYLARDLQRKPVFTLGPDVYADLSRDLWAYRQKDLVTVRQDEIRTLTYRRGEESFRVAQSDFKWTIEEPERLAGREALSYKFWYPIDDLEFTAILQDVTLPEPEVELVIAKRDDAVEHVRFARSGADVLAWKGEGERVGRISAENFEKILLAADDIVEAPPAPAASPEDDSEP